MPRALALAACIALAVPGAARAVSVRTWTLSSAEEFAGGRFAGTALDAGGRVRLAPTVDELWGPEDGIVWDVEPDGARGVFVALSSPGRVLRVGDGRPEIWFAPGDESLAGAIEPDGQGGVYIGLSPAGTLLHARAPGDVHVVADMEAKFVWALERGPDGSIWIGTGIPGALLRHVPGGGIEEVFRTGDDPVRCLLVEDDGRVVLGTGGSGRVARIGADGRASVLLEADEAEIVSIVPEGDGSYHVLAASGSKQISAARVAASQEADETVVATTAPEPEGEEAEPVEQGPAEGQPRPSPAPPQRFRTPPGGVLYRLMADGDAQRVWTSASEVPFDLVRLADGRILVATGDLGRIHALDPEGRSSVLIDVPSDQASALALDPAGDVLIGATTDARVGRLRTGSSSPGTYLGPTVDAGTVADWGRLTWGAEVPEGSELRVSVRSGNTSEPDVTWSEWVPLGQGPSGDVPAGAAPGRRLQVKVDMEPSRKGASPVLRRLELFFAPRNRRPVIEAIEVQPPGVVWAAAAAPGPRPVGPVVTVDSHARRTVEALGAQPGAMPVRKTYEAGARTIAWRVVDPDADALRYRLDVRRDEDAAWTPLAEELEDEFYGWDTRAMPDGLYRVRLTVDDAPDNVPGAHYTDERMSPAFLVDNTRPSAADPVVRRESGGWVVEFVAGDAGGTVAGVEVAVDAGEWRSVEPLDGVADSSEERYRVRLDVTEASGAEGPPTLRVRVTDSAGNLGGQAWPLEGD